MQDSSELPQQHLRVERDAVKEAGLVGVADIDMLILESRHLLVALVFQDARHEIGPRVVFLFARLIPPVQSVVRVYNNLQKANAAASRFFEIMDADEAIMNESAIFGRCFATEDQKEGMAAFLEKRKPTYKGK